MTKPGGARSGGTGRAPTRIVERVVRHRSTRLLLRATGVSKLRRSIRWRAEHTRWLQRGSRLRLHNNSVMYPLDARTGADAAAENAEIVLGTLDESGIPYSEVRHGGVGGRVTVAVPRSHRRQLLSALSARHADDAVYVAPMVEYAPDGSRGVSVVPAGLLAKERRPVTRFAGKIDTVAVMRVWKFFVDHPSGFVLGSGYGCEIEFWEESDDEAMRWMAPRVNVAGIEFSASDVTFLPRKRQAVERPPSVFDLRMIDEIDFPIDVVYTWVDSSDPKWREKFEAYSGRSLPDLHREARVDQRFRSRDELRYSLRSLSMYAPWVRHVYIVTDDQVPEFIDFDRAGISLVDHSEIAKVPEALPIFNSSAITTWLHRIPGLSEHFIYMNDDVFLGRDIAPSRFYTPSGLARVFPSQNRRPFGDPNPQDEPHINITRNIRALIETEFGRSISRSVKHTPHAQLVSVQFEMEKRFPDAYDRTSRSRFRHHEDIAADQLFHYYGQITGRAVVASIRYAYVNIGDRRTEPELQRLLETRGREVFCLNDVPEQDAEAMTDATVRSFLDAYFPVPSKWERR